MKHIQILNCSNEADFSDFLKNAPHYKLSSLKLSGSIKNIERILDCLNPKYLKYLTIYDSGDIKQEDYLLLAKSLSKFSSLSDLQIPYDTDSDLPNKLSQEAMIKTINNSSTIARFNVCGLLSLHLTDYNKQFANAYEGYQRQQDPLLKKQCLVDIYSWLNSNDKYCNDYRAKALVLEPEFWANTLPQVYRDGILMLPVHEDRIRYYDPEELHINFGGGVKALSSWNEIEPKVRQKVLKNAFKDALIEFEKICKKYPSDESVLTHLNELSIKCLFALGVQDWFGQDLEEILTDTGIENPQLLSLLQKKHSAHEKLKSILPDGISAIPGLHDLLNEQNISRQALRGIFFNADEDIKDELSNMIDLSIKDKLTSAIDDIVNSEDSFARKVRASTADLIQGIKLYKDPLHEKGLKVKHHTEQFTTDLFAKYGIEDWLNCIKCAGVLVSQLATEIDEFKKTIKAKLYDLQDPAFVQGANDFLKDLESGYKKKISQHKGLLQLTVEVLKKSIEEKLPNLQADIAEEIQTLLTSQDFVKITAKEKLKILDQFLSQEKDRDAFDGESEDLNNERENLQSKDYILSDNDKQIEVNNSGKVDTLDDNQILSEFS